MILQIPYTEHVTNKEILRKMGRRFEKYKTNWTLKEGGAETKIK